MEILIELCLEKRSLYRGISSLDSSLYKLREIPPGISLYRKAEERYNWFGGGNYKLQRSVHQIAGPQLFFLSTGPNEALMLCGWIEFVDARRGSSLELGLRFFFFVQLLPMEERWLGSGARASIFWIGGCMFSCC